LIRCIFKRHATAIRRVTARIDDVMAPALLNGGRVVIGLLELPSN
jgi:hypothetical protein